MNEPICGYFGKYRWLSNFGPGECHFNEIVFPYRENAYQYGKGLLGGEDPNSLLMIGFHSDTTERSMYTPAKAKAKGHKVKIHPDWDVLRLHLMELIVGSWLELNNNFKNDLIATGDVELIEANYWHDLFFGVCYGTLFGNLGITYNRRCKYYPHEPIGENNLGKLHMVFRKKLKG